jgi:protein tyrosine phosphatase
MDNKGMINHSTGAIVKKGYIDVKKFVSDMRKARMYMIQTEEQFIFVHTALLESRNSTNIPKGEFPNWMKTAGKPSTGKVQGQSPMNRFEMQFERIKALPPSDKPYTVAMATVNARKNRYSNLLPFDHNRVRLHNSQDDEVSYINASIITGYRASDKGFIAAAAAVEKDREDFWHMTFDNNSKTIVCLTDLAENGREKCSQYWPQLGATEQFGSVSVTCTDETDHQGDYVTSRKFKVEKGGVVSVVLQLHYLGFPWDDQDAPASPRGILRIYNEDVAWAAANQDAGPTVVHCSSGMGRTGVYIALSQAIQRATEGDGEIDLFQMVVNLRSQRNQMVQTQAQYRFLFDAIAEYLKK